MFGSLNWRAKKLSEIPLARQQRAPRAEVNEIETTCGWSRRQRCVSGQLGQLEDSSAATNSAPAASVSIFVLLFRFARPGLKTRKQAGESKQRAEKVLSETTFSTFARARATKFN